MKNSMNTTSKSLIPGTSAAEAQRLGEHPQPTRAALLLRPGLLAVGCAVFLAGCTVTPKALAPEEVKTRVAEDSKQMYANQEPISGPVSMEEALARALKYNLDYRLKRMESALALGLTDYASKDMLPQLLARAGYQERSNDSGGVSVGILDRVVSDRPTSSAERHGQQSGIAFTWNALDFGVSYYRAKQQGDQFLIAEERRRKVVHNLLQDVRAAYWRALGAQRLNAQADEVLNRARTALSRSREAETQRAISPGIALAYQRALLDATSLLSQRRQELQYAKQELAALMSVPTGVNFELAATQEPKLPPMPSDMAKLEEMALMQRPELREEDLRKRISADEARKQMLSLLPGITFSAGRQSDSNKYLYNSAWSEGGVSLAWNLMRLASLPSMREAQKYQESTDEARRAALSMAILTQARLGAERYRMAVLDHDLAAQAAQVDQRLAAFTKASVSARLESELEAIRTQARAVLGAYQQANAYSNAHIAYGRLYNALGFDPLPDDFHEADLATLTRRMHQYLEATERDAYAISSQLFGAIASLSVQVIGLGDTAQTVRLTALAKDVLQRHEIDVAGSGQRHMQLSMEYIPVGAGLQRMQWTITLNADGQTQAKVLRFDAVVPADARMSVQETALNSALSTRMAEIKQWIAS